MKTTKLILLFAITYLCSSCLGGLFNPDVAAGGSMSCTINGSSWKANEASAINILGSLSITGLSGSGKNTQTILLTIDQTKVKAGTTIDLSDESNNLIALLTSYTKTVNGVDNLYAVSEGTIKITSVSGKKVEGTFSFPAEDFSGENKPVKIENGKFSVNIFL
jgi:Family of unknown function (DUF6252)